MFNRIKNIFKKARLPVSDIITAFRGGSDAMYDDIEEQLILSDVSMETANYIISELKKRVKQDIITEQDDFKDALKEIISSLFTHAVYPGTEKKPLVIMIYGINGAGKTTSIAKLSHYFRNKGHNKIMLCAADTFRAAADEQLKIWSQRTGADIFIANEQKDPAAVAYASYEKAVREQYDVLIVDTAGRMHTNKNLMKEIEKIYNVLTGKFTDINLFTMLIIDATNGSNALTQAKQFSEILNTDALFLTKIDGTAKGGTIITIAHKMSLPVSFAGTGEGSEDMWLFDPHAFIDSIIG